MRAALPALFLVALNCAFSCRAQGIPCLTTKEQNRLQRARGVERRLEVYEKAGRRQISDILRRLTTVYGPPWSERVPPDPTPTLYMLEETLRRNDCVWGKMLKELEGWHATTPAAKGRIARVYRDIARDHELILWARDEAELFPEIHEHVEISTEAVRDVEAVMKTLIEEPLP
jgi:hypothetical protein